MIKVSCSLPMVPLSILEDVIEATKAYKEIRPKYLSVKSRLEKARDVVKPHIQGYPYEKDVSILWVRYNQIWKIGKDLSAAHDTIFSQGLGYEKGGGANYIRRIYECENGNLFFVCRSLERNEQEEDWYIFRYVYLPDYLKKCRDRGDVYIPYRELQTIHQSVKQKVIEEYRNLFATKIQRVVKNWLFYKPPNGRGYLEAKARFEENVALQGSN